MPAARKGKGIIMKIHTIKKAAVLLCAAAVMSGISGCGGGDTASDGVQTVTIWTGDSHSKNDMLELVEQFNKNKGKELGVKVEYTVKESNNLSQAIEMAIASQQEPDMYKTWSTQKYYESGDIVALDEIEGGSEYLESFPKDMIERFRNKNNGHIFTVPYYVNTFGVAYNKDMFKKYGITDENGNAKAPETYAEFCECAKKLTNAAEGEYGIIMPLKESSFYQNVGKLTFSSEGTSGYNHKSGTYEYEKLAPAMQLLLDMKHDESVYPGADGIDNDTARALFAEGKIGMIFTGSYDVSVFTKQFPAKCDWDAAPFPVEDKDNKYLQKMSGDGGIVMNRDMYERLGAQKSLEVFKWYHGDEMLAELYKRGCSIPENPEIIKDVKPNDNVHKAWESFGNLLNISYVEHTAMPTDLEGTPDLKTLFQTKLWMEDGDMTSILSDLSKRSNDGIAKKEAVMSNFDRNKYIINDFDVKRN